MSRETFIRKLSIMADGWYDDHIKPGMDQDEARQLISDYSHQKLNCDHPDKHVVYRLDSLGRKIFRWQCPYCLETLSQAIKIAGNSEKIPMEIPVDYASENSARMEIYRRLLDKLSKAKNTSWWNWYNEYLKSDQWREKHNLIMQRAGGMCEGCGKQKATQVHHLTYTHAGNELLWELVAICDTCHDRLNNEPKAAGY